MIALCLNNFIVFFFLYRGRFWEKIVLNFWSINKYFFYEPYYSTLKDKKNIDLLFSNRNKYFSKWYGVKECDILYTNSIKSSITTFKKNHTDRKVDYFKKFHIHSNFTNQIHEKFKLEIIKFKKFDDKIFRKLNFLKKLLAYVFTKNYLIAISSLIFHFFLLILYLFKELILKRKISYRKKKIKRKFIIDHVYGVENENIINSIIKPHNDGFLLDLDKNINSNDLILYNRFWDIPNFKIKEQELTKKNLIITGTRNKICYLSINGFLESIKNCYIYFFKLSKYFNFYSNTEFHKSLIKFIVKYIITLWDFDHVFGKVYLSRIDYSSDHHAVGLACNTKNIHFSGISHSPGLGYHCQPTGGILSFDSFFYHSDTILNDFFPSWKISFSKLYPIGVWRGDYVYKFLLNEKIKMKRKKLLSHHKCKKIISLHLPVVQVFDIDESATKMWLKSIVSIIKNNLEFLFIVSIRRDEEVNYSYYNNFLKTIFKSKNVISSNEIFSKNSQTYNITAISDLTISQNHSDVFFESISNNILALSYTTKGVGLNYLDSFFQKFKANSGIQLIKTFNWINLCPNEALKEMKVVQKKILLSDGNSRLKLLKILKKQIDNSTKF